MDRHAFDDMANVEDEHWWFVGRRRILGELIERRVSLPQAARILEAGCGTGGNLGLLARHGSLDAFEFDDEAREIAKLKGIGDIFAGALPDGLTEVGDNYDLVALLDVLEHIEDDRAALAALKSKIAANGALLVTVPAYGFLYSEHDRLHHHHRRYSKSQLESALVEARFKIEYISYFNTALFVPAAIGRLLEKLTNRSSGGAQLPAPAINSVLTGVFAAERHLLSRLGLPFGLSLCAICRHAK